MKRNPSIRAEDNGIQIGDLSEAVVEALAIGGLRQIALGDLHLLINPRVHFRRALVLYAQGEQIRRIPSEG